MPHYPFALRLLHWLTLLALLIAYGSIESRSLFELSIGQRKIIAFTHVYAGMTVLIMMLSRLLFRVRTQVNNVTQQGWHYVAQLGHGLLYLLFITVPLLSLTARYFNGHEWSWMGMAMPISEYPNRALAKTIMSWHKDIAHMGYWLIGLHTLAALFHQFVLKDNRLRAMRLWGK